jgi:hypothetical protein
MTLLKKLFKRASDSLKKNEKELNADEVESIVNAYGALLEKGVPASGCVADVNKLPDTKERVMNALLMTMLSAVDPELKAALKFGFTNLANFQEGVGERDIGLDLSGIDAKNMTKEDLIRLAKEIQEPFSEYEKWIPIIEKEQNELEQILKTLGL